MPRQESKQQSKLPRLMAFDIIASTMEDNKSKILADNGKTQLIFDPNSAYCFINADSKTGDVFKRSMTLYPTMTMFFSLPEQRRIKREVAELKKKLKMNLAKA